MRKHAGREIVRMLEHAGRAAPAAAVVPGTALLSLRPVCGSDAARVMVLDLAAKAYRRTINIDPTLKERSLQWSWSP
ncbi:MAG TPA: hypothetical protein VHE11_12825 [Steroidobacteraceae bacterium]|nr:hypothetical protein [Steroidobacteraceae bacterium]